MLDVDQLNAIAERVKLGFNKLTREQRDLIDIFTLHMDSDWDCVLGQIFGRYATGMDELFPETFYDIVLRDKLGMEYGFFQSYRDSDAFKIYEELQTEWIHLLCEERALS